MSSTFAPPLHWRPLALPPEHGGWGLVLEPVVLGLLVAPSAVGFAIAAGAVGAFLARHPLKLALQDRLRGKRYPRTGACELLVLAYGAVALLIAIAPLRALIPIALAVPFALTQLAFDVRNQGRALWPEALGAIAPGSLASAIALAAGAPSLLAATLWLACALRAIPSILYVRNALRGGSRASSLTAHGIALVIAALVSPYLAAAIALLFIRALLPAGDVPAKTIGFREIGWGVVVVLIVGLSI